MFKFDFRVVTCSKNDIKVTNESRHKLNDDIGLILDSFEKKVYDLLIDIQDFDYVQGTVGAFKVFNFLKKGLDQNFDIKIITQHPSYIGSKLIEDLIPSIYSGKELYLVYFKDEISISWLNSKAQSSQLINSLSQLLKIATLNRDIKFNLIEVYGSERMNFIQVNKGNNENPRWKIK